MMTGLLIILFINVLMTGVVHIIRGVHLRNHDYRAAENVPVPSAFEFILFCALGYGFGWLFGL